MKNSELDKAMAEFDAANYQSARVLLELTERNPAADLALAYIYQQGLGGEVEIEKAVRLYEALVERGDQQSMYYLGTLYLSKQELSTALYNFEMAASRGHVSAAYWVAALYDGLDGFPKDRTRYLAAIKRASELGHLFAKRDVARIEMKKTGAHILQRLSWLFKYIFAKIHGIFLSVRNPNDLRLR